MITCSRYCSVGSRNCKCRKPILWCVRGIVFQGKERNSKYKDDVTFLLCSYIQTYWFAKVGKGPVKHGSRWLVHAERCWTLCFVGARMYILLGWVQFQSWLTMPTFFICSTYCLVVGEGKDISNMTQDAKLVHMLNIVFCVEKGLNFMIMTSRMTRQVNLLHMLNVLCCRAEGGR